RARWVRGSGQAEHLAEAWCVHPRPFNGLLARIVCSFCFMRKKTISRAKSKPPVQGFDMTTKGAKIGPCILSGQFVRLEPLRKRHVAELYKSARRLDWSLLLGQLRSKEYVEMRIENGLEAEKSDSEYAFEVTLIQ